jgi:hypothetical protein
MIDLGDDGKVTPLPVRFKGPLPDERTLLAPYEVGKTKCSHFPVRAIVDASLAEVTCGDCGEKLNPMWVLAQLANRDRNFAEAHARYHEQMKRLSERTSTKCRHCGKMTRISNA